MARKVQEINASSMADIAFLLLIFFLVTTTMDIDSGIQRVLPPMVEDIDERGVDVNKRNLLLVFVSSGDEIMVGGQRMDVTMIKDKVQEFILNPNNDPELPTKKPTEIDLIGTFQVSEGIVSLQNDRGTSYNTYVKVQNELTRAFNEVRDAVANQYFGKKFGQLSDEQRDAVTKAVPLKISEAEPRNIGGV